MEGSETDEIKQNELMKQVQTGCHKNILLSIRKNRENKQHSLPCFWTQPQKHLFIALTYYQCHTEYINIELM